MAMRLIALTVVLVFLFFLCRRGVNDLLVVEVDVEKELSFILLEDVGVLATRATPSSSLENTKGILKRLFKGIPLIVLALLTRRSKLYFRHLIPCSFSEYKPIDILRIVFMID